MQDLGQQLEINYLTQLGTKIVFRKRDKFSWEEWRELHSQGSDRHKQNTYKHYPICSYVSSDRYFSIAFVGKREVC